ncbi:hypothetical protein V8G54_009367 [Vigna mungo]|uniref:Polysaccharide biosynthesis domain-containing protein n=1 Tax=Vigna mungo TaxID=3915 RepID=A0AAQ3NV22_VIGMU
MALRGTSLPLSVILLAKLVLKQQFYVEGANIIAIHNNLFHPVVDACENLKGASVFGGDDQVKHDLSVGGRVEDGLVGVVVHEVSIVREGDGAEATVLKDAPLLRAHTVHYRTKLREADQFLSSYRSEPACSPITARLRGNERCKLTLQNLPDEGYFAEAPGRMAAICSAAVMARDRKGSGMTHVFLHDVDRKVEKVYAEEFHCRTQLMKGVGRLWRFEIPPGLITLVMKRVSGILKKSETWHDSCDKRWPRRLLKLTEENTNFIIVDDSGRERYDCKKGKREEMVEYRKQLLSDFNWTKPVPSTEPKLLGFYFWHPIITK